MLNILFKKMKKMATTTYFTLKPKSECRVYTDPDFLPAEPYTTNPNIRIIKNYPGDYDEFESPDVEILSHQYFGKRN